MSFVVVKRSICFFINIAFFAFGDLLFFTSKKK